MQAGDQFIKYTKNGAIKGRVKSIQVKYKYDLANKVKFEVLVITTETGEKLDSVGCYVVREEITFLEALQIKKLMSKVRNLFGKKKV